MLPIKRLKVYLESSISSYYTALPSPDPIKAAWQAYTIKWVEDWADKCDLFVSNFWRSTMNDDIVEEIHRIRHELLAEHGGDMDAYNKALSQMTFPGFKVAHLEPVKPFAWNGGVRPEPLIKLAA